MKRIYLSIFLSTVLSCGVQEPEDTDANASASVSADSTVTETLGLSLYNRNCKSCHGSIENSQVKYSSPGEIIQSIQEISSMAFLSSLTEDEIDQISDALNTEY